MAVTKTTSRRKKTATADNTVVVALNYPTKLSFDLKSGRRVVLNGNAEELRGQEKGHIPAGGFGLTAIPADDWEEIKATYGKMKLIRNGLLFASSDAASAEDEAEEKAGTRHGREPVSETTKTTQAAKAD